MSDTPLNIYPKNVVFGKTAEGKEVYIDPKWHRLIELMIQRMGGPSNYTISDLSSLTFTDGGFLVGDGTTLVVESGATARTSLDVPSNAEAILQSLINAKGDLIVGSADNTAARLAVHATNGAYPRSASGESAGIEWQKNNMAATAAPAVTNDVDEGYTVGSRWLDTTNDKEYVCLDNTDGAAVWKETTGGGGGGGSIVLLEELTASGSASLDFESSISSTYDEYVISLINVIPATDGALFLMRVSVDAGANYSATGYEYVDVVNSTSNAGIASNTSTSATAWQLFAAVDSGAGYGVNGKVHMFNPGSASLGKTVNWEVNGPFNTVARRYHATGSGFWPTTTAVNAFQFLFSTGNIASGTIRVYGVAKS